MYPENSINTLDIFLVVVAVNASTRAEKDESSSGENAGQTLDKVKEYVKSLLQNGANTLEEAINKAQKKFKTTFSQQNIESIRNLFAKEFDNGQDFVLKMSNGQNASNNFKKLTDELNKFRTRSIDHTIGVALILIGLFLVYRGRSMLKLFLVIVGFLMGLTVGLYLTILAENIVATYELQYKIVEWHEWVLCLLLAIFGSILMVTLYKLAFALVCLFGGIYAGISAIGLSQLQLSSYQRYLVLGVFGAISVAFSRKFEQAAVITATAIMGSFVLTVGLDSVYNFGFREFINAVISIMEKKVSILSLMESSVTNTLRAVLVCSVFVTISGIYVQYRNLPRRSSKL